MLKHACLAAMAVITVFFTTPAKADNIEIPREEFGSVDDAQMDSLTEQLKEIGAIESDDELEATGDAGPTPQGVDPVSIAMLFGPLVCKYVVSEQRAKKIASCEKKQTDEAKASCRTNIEGWADPVSKLCDLIKLN